MVYQTSNDHLHIINALIFHSQFTNTSSEVTRPDEMGEKIKIKIFHVNRDVNKESTNKRSKKVFERKDQ